MILSPKYFHGIVKVKAEPFVAIVMAVALSGSFFLVRDADAAVGKLDTSNVFPYVVQLVADGWRCSGVVTSDNLVTTAAHCVWNDERGGLVDRRSLRILVTDIYGERKRVGVRRIFVPEEYIQKRSGGAPGSKVIHDLAILIPDELIEVSGYANWITELLVPPYSEYLIRIGCHGLHRCARDPTKEDDEYLAGILRKAIGAIGGARTLVIGYGKFECPRYTGGDASDSSCRDDNQRRFAEAPLDESETVIPKMWCIGRNSEGLIPIRAGDSGGPMFVRALDGRWLFVGYISTGSNDRACASSLIPNLRLWKSALESPEYAAMPKGRGNDWYIKQVERAVGEIFAAFSLPNNEAIPRLHAIYKIFEDANGELYGLGGLRDRDSHRIELLGEKRQLFEQWPSRKFKVVPDSLNIEATRVRPRDELTSDYIRADGIVSWEFSNPTIGARRASRSQFSFVFVTAGLEQSLINGGTYYPTIFEEDMSIPAGPGRTPPPGERFQILRGTTLLGGDYWNSKGMSLQRCQEFCQTERACVSFSYVERSQWCWAKSSIPPRSLPKEGIISGYKWN